jgi:hypothetical protein
VSASHRMRTAALGAVLVALAFLWPPAAGHAARAQQVDEPLEIEVRAGFDGYVQPGTWTPITVTASNDGPDVTGELRVQVDPLTGARTNYVYPIELPRGSRKQVMLYVADLSGFGNEIQVDLVERGRVVTSERVQLQFANANVLLVGIWSDSPQGLIDIAQVTPSSGETRLAVLTAEDFPAEAPAWAALDALVIADADTGQLSPEQRTALGRWVMGGGRLVIVGGLGYQRVLSGLEDIVPVADVSVSTVELASLAEAVDAPFGPQTPTEGPAAVGAPIPGARALVDGEGGPLVVWRPSGYGFVAYLAPDPGLNPLFGWEGMAPLWRMVLSAGNPRPAWAYEMNAQWDYARQAVAAVPGVSLPSVVQLCGFLALYVGLIGPVNYFVLTRLKRRELAWFTIPALILLFSGVAYVTGFQLRGSRAILHRLALIQTGEGEDTAQVDALVGVWSPRRARYDLEVGPGFLARPMPRDFGGAFASVAEMEVEQGDGVEVRGIQVDVGSIQPLVVEGFMAGGLPVESALTLTPEAGGVRVRGEVRNEGEVDLIDVSLALGGTVVALPNLPAGSAVDVDEVLAGGQASRGLTSSLDPYPPEGSVAYGGLYNTFVSGVSGGDCYSLPEYRRRCNLLLSMTSTQVSGTDVYLFGWADSIPVDMRILGGPSDAVDTALYVVKLDADLGAGAGEVVEVPPGLMVWNALDDRYTWTSPYDLYMYPDETYTFQYKPLPVVGPIEVESFVVHLERDYGTDAPPEILLRNVETGRWEVLQGADYGDTVVEDAARYVGPGNVVDLRVAGGTQSFGSQITRLDITLRGTTAGEE